MVYEGKKHFLSCIYCIFLQMMCIRQVWGLFYSVNGQFRSWRSFSWEQLFLKMMTIFHSMEHLWQLFFYSSQYLTFRGANKSGEGCWMLPHIGIRAPPPYNPEGIFRGLPPAGHESCCSIHHPVDFDFAKPITRRTMQILTPFPNAIPTISNKPYLLGLKLPTGAVDLSHLSLHLCYHN